MSKQINITTTNASTFEQIISKTNFIINYTFLFAWLALALAATARSGLFIPSIIYFFIKTDPNPTTSTNTSNLVPHPNPQFYHGRIIKSNPTTNPTTTTGYNISKSIVELQPQPTGPAVKFQKHQDYFLSEGEMS
jgi:hypothetical protein